MNPAALLALWEQRYFELTPEQRKSFLEKGEVVRIVAHPKQSFAGTGHALGRPHPPASSVRHVRCQWNPASVGSSVTGS